MTRVAREVGTEGKLGGQAEVQGRRGHVEGPDRQRERHGRRTSPPRCATSPRSTTAVANGDLSQKITVDAKGEILELKNTINTMVDQLNSFAAEVTRVASEVGTEGKLGGQADVKGVAGTWKDLTDNVNVLAAQPHRRRCATSPTVTTAVAQRRPVPEDHGRRARRDPRAQEHHQHDGRSARSFAAEVTRVAKEVGTEGKLGGQAECKGVSGTWKDLTDNVNVAGRQPHRPRSATSRKVTTAVANGDLSQKITVDVKGEILELEEHHQHHGRPAQLLRRGGHARGAREVGTEGKLGGQAEVKGVSGVEGPDRQR